MVTFTDTSVGDTATYTCNSGFELIGDATTTCTQVDANSALFTPAQPFCRREHCVKINGASTWLLVFIKIRVSQKKTLQKKLLIEAYEARFDLVMIYSHLHNFTCSSSLITNNLIVHIYDALQHCVLIRLTSTMAW